MKRTLKLFVTAMLGSLLTLTSCNTDSESPQLTAYTFGVVKQGIYSTSDYLLLPDGKLALCKGLPATFNDGDLAYAYCTIDSEHADTNAYKYTLSIQEAIKVNPPFIRQTRLDTLGNGTFRDDVSLAMMEKYLIVYFDAVVENGDNFFLAADSVKLGSNRLVKNDTMFLEIRHRSKLSYGSYSLSSALCANLRNENFDMKNDTMVVALKYKLSENTYKTKYTVARRQYVK